MSLLRALCLVLVLLPASLMAEPVLASMEGTVGLGGTTPTLKALAIGGDSFCNDCAGGESIPDNRIQVNPNGTLSGALIYIKAGLRDDLKNTTSSKNASLVADCCQFQPRVLAVRTGQKITVRNKDATVHTVSTQAQNNPRVNHVLKRADGNSLVELKFDNPELPVPVRCNIHPWMAAYIGVFDHPYFTVTDETGKFRFENLPPGEYVVGLWHEVLGEHEREVTLGGGGVPSRIEFRLMFERFD